MDNNAMKKNSVIRSVNKKKNFWPYIFLLNKTKIELANDFHNPYNLDFKTKNLVSESRYSWNIPFASQCSFKVKKPSGNKILIRSSR